MQDYAFQQRRIKPKSKSSGGRRAVFFIIVVILLLWVIVKGLHALFSLGDVIKEIQVIENRRDDKQSSSLESIVQKTVRGVNGRYGIFIKNLKTGEAYSYHADETFDSASLYKLWVMGSVFDAIENGKISRDDTLKEDVEVLNDKFQIASESAELTDGTIEQTVSDSLEKMITVSDNYSALLLAWKLRLSTVASYMAHHGLNESKVGVNGGSPSTTASDIGLFFEKLYTGQLGNQSSTSDMLALLKRQALNEKIPKLLPKGTVIAHKTGELDTLSHDAGIVYSPKGDYIIVVLTDTSTPADAVDHIATLSKDVYSYFTK